VVVRGVRSTPIGRVWSESTTVQNRGNDSTGSSSTFGSLFNLSWRIPLPRVKFPRVDSTGQIPNRLHLAAYRVSRWFWHGMDGRHGWFTAHRRKVRKDLKQWYREEQARHEERVRRLVAK
jgi:hypothetical protein